MSTMMMKVIVMVRIMTVMKMLPPTLMTVEMLPCENDNCSDDDDSNDGNENEDLLLLVCRKRKLSLFPSLGITL